MAVSDCAATIPVFRCCLCETLFEAGVADSGPNGEPRCPQCGVAMAEPAVPRDEDFVIRAGTKFR